MKETIVVILIGIRYEHGEGHLRGCHNDIKNIYDYLNNLYKHDDKYNLDFIILADSKVSICDNHPNIWPTKKNILENLQNTIGKYKKYFIHYSGHGSSIKDYSGDEPDYKDEVICPIDYSSQGIIKDDVLNSFFLNRLDNDVFVRILMDCCRSGTIWDLKYKYSNNGYQENSLSPKIRCNVLTLSGCKDTQYSYDVFTDGESQGAFTYCFLKSIKENQNLMDFLNNINKNLILGGWEKQTSVLSSSFKVNDKNIFFQWDNVNIESNDDTYPNIIENSITTSNDPDFFVLFSFCSVM